MARTGDITPYDFKIILTTNNLLIKDGVQAIGDEFLEWFVKNPSCEFVNVEKTFVTNSGLGYQEYAVLDSNFKVIEINAKIPQTSYYLDKVTILNTYEYVINYKIIIPQEETKQEELKFKNRQIGAAGFVANKIMENMISKPKQETLEEAAERLYPTVGLIGEYRKLELNVPKNEGFIEGAKWQAERMYSEQEVYNLLYKLLPDKQELDEWFSQFKKK